MQRRKKANRGGRAGPSRGYNVAPPPAEALNFPMKKEVGPNVASSLEMAALAEGFESILAQRELLTPNMRLSFTSPNLNCVLHMNRFQERTILEPRPSTEEEEEETAYLEHEFPYIAPLQLLKRLTLDFAPSSIIYEHTRGQQSERFDETEAEGADRHKTFLSTSGEIIFYPSTDELPDRKTVEYRDDPSDVFHVERFKKLKFEELKHYVIWAIYLGDAERFRSESLAKADPQRWWNMILRFGSVEACLVWVKEQIGDRHPRVSKALAALPTTPPTEKASLMKGTRTGRPFERQHREQIPCTKAGLVSVGRPPKLHKCDGCEKTEATSNEFKTCGQCKRVRYCSRECQKAAWKEHKKVCAMLAKLAS